MKRTHRTAHALSKPWKSPGQFSLLATLSDPVHAKKASPSKGSDSLVNIFTESDFLISLWLVWGGGFALKGGKSSSSSAIEAVLARGVETVKSSSNIDRGESESESNRNLAAGEFTDPGDAVSSPSNANLWIGKYQVL